MRRPWPTGGCGAKKKERKKERKKSKAIPSQASTGPEGSSRLRLTDFKITGT